MPCSSAMLEHGALDSLRGRWCDTTHGSNQQPKKIQDYEDYSERTDSGGYGSVWICRHRRDERLLVRRDGGDETRSVGTAAVLREVLQGHRRTRHRRHTALTRAKAVRMVMFRVQLRGFPRSGLNTAFFFEEISLLLIYFVIIKFFAKFYLFYLHTRGL